MTAVPNSSIVCMHIYVLSKLEHKLRGIGRLELAKGLLKMIDRECRWSQHLDRRARPRQDGNCLLKRTLEKAVAVLTKTSPPAETLLQ